MNADLNRLIQGLCRNNGMCDPQDVISKEAHDYARKLEDVGLFGDLVQAYDEADDEVRRRMIVRLIGTIEKS